MKVIDLVDKIANGEIPEKIRYNDLIMTYDKKRQNYYDSFGAEIDWKYTIMQYLNDEVEIIEDTPKEYINVSEEQVLFNNLSYEEQQFILKQMRELNEQRKTIEDTSKDKKIEKLDVVLLGQCDNWLQPTIDTTEEIRAELNPYIIDVIRENTLVIQRKINEIIDKINKGEKNE